MLSDHKRKSPPLKFRWLDELKGERLRVTPTELMLLLRFAHYANEYGELCPSTRRLARDIGNDNLYRVRAAIKRLKARGLIETISPEEVKGKPIRKLLQKLGRKCPKVRRLKLPIPTRKDAHRGPQRAPLIGARY